MGDDAFRGCATAATRKRKYYELARAAHPDAPGGSCGAFAALNAAYRRGPPPRGPPKSLDNLEGLAREAVLVGFDAFEPTVRHAAGHVPGPLCQLLIDGGHQVLRKFEGLKWVDNKHGPGWCSNVYHAVGHVSRELCSFVEQVPLCWLLLHQLAAKSRR